VSIYVGIIAYLYTNKHSHNPTQLIKFMDHHSTANLDYTLSQNVSIPFQFFYQNYYKPIKDYLNGFLDNHANNDEIPRPFLIKDPSHKEYGLHELTSIFYYKSRDILNGKYNSLPNNRVIKIMLEREKTDVLGPWVFRVTDEINTTPNMKEFAYTFIPDNPKTCIKEFKIWMSMPRNLPLIEFNEEYNRRVSESPNYLGHIFHEIIKRSKKQNIFSKLPEDQILRIRQNVHGKPPFFINESQNMQVQGDFDYRGSGWGYHGIQREGNSNPYSRYT
jgi:hypothetical protein